MITETYIPTERELLPQARVLLRECLAEVPFITQDDMETDVALGNGLRVDLKTTVRTPGEYQVLLAELRRNGEPRMVRAALNSLHRYLEEMTGAYGLVMAPYISPQAAELCIREGCGFLDFAGNCRISFGQVYIRREGRPNPVEKRPLRSLYSPKAERVLRVLLNEPVRTWGLQELAQVSEVSLGQAHNVKERMLDREWLRVEDGKLRLSAPGPLLEEWAAAYDPGRSRARGFYALSGVADAERLLAEVCERSDVQYALTGFSGAGRLAPFVRYQRGSAYVAAIDTVARLLEPVGFREVETGANFTLLEPYDAGVFHGATQVEGAWVVAPVQLYLDLSKASGRGPDAAEYLREQVLERRA